MTVSMTLELPELWMELKDPSLLKLLMEEKKVSARQLSRDAGWRSHSYMNRLVAGKAKNLEAVPAARIAHRLGVPFSVLFTTRVSEIREQSVRKTKERA